MTIARVTMHEFFDEDGIEKVEQIYTEVRDQLFPNLLQVINIKTGPTSGIPLHFILRLRKLKKISRADKKCWI